MTPLLLLAAATGGVALDPRATIALPGSVVRIGDVVPALAQGRLARVIVLRLPTATRTRVVTRKGLASLIARAVPGLEMVPAGSGSIRLVATPRRLDGRGCFVTTAASAAGEPVSVAAATGPQCIGKPVALHYDRDGRRLVAVRAMTSGERVALLPSAPPVIAKGDGLTLVARSGAVTVERPVTALQSARASGRVFVRDSGGQVMSIEVAR